jgi:transcription initiation factor TFIID TATA-box-binding protein
MRAKSKDDPERLYNALAEIVGEVDIDILAAGNRPENRNLICKANLGREVGLSALGIGLGLHNIEYEPEQSLFCIIGRSVKIA